MLKNAQVIQDLEDQLATMKAVHTKYTKTELPELFTQYGLTEITLADGRVIKMVEDTFASISEANQTGAFTWLRENDHGGLIKNQVVADIGKGMDKEALQLIQHIQDMGLDYKAKQSVHPQTLKAFVKEQLAEGTKDFPLQLFGVFREKSVVVKQPKGTKKNG